MGKSKAEGDFPFVKWITKDFKGVRFVESDLQYLYDNMDPVVAVIAERDGEVMIPVWDLDTGGNYLLKLKKDKDGVFGLYEDWIEIVAKRRGFEGNEAIGFYVNQVTLELTFTVINPTNNVAGSSK
uniref:TF-B3 domain-containing protein n=1 Tax=Solanum lycopersicum TaxID=4081 RepID=A0A3Q7FI38_SOLLC